MDVVHQGAVDELIRELAPEAPEVDTLPGEEPDGGPRPVASRRGARPPLAAEAHPRGAW
ncbi:MAG TPA: hypothetical protein VEW93_00790 [Acidimicrobiales bacterium]|nr:hypothetical protein [Acidimicrobiales bacterium]